MGARLLPRTLPELYAHALVMERDATKRFEIFAHCMRETGADHLAEEFEAIGKEEREQYYMGPSGDVVPAPQSVRDVLKLAISAERRTQNFYADVAENVEDDAVSAFAAEMAADEGRHIDRLERLLAREPMPAALDEKDLQDTRARKAA